MKKNILIIIMLIVTTNLFSQTDTSSIAFVSYWSLGDSYDFKVSKIKKQWKKGKLTKDQTFSYTANFTVIDSTENSYTIKWSYKNDFENTYKIPQTLHQKLSKYEKVDIKYKTSELGEFIEIINWEEVGENMSNMIDDIIDLYKTEDTKKQEAINSSMNIFKQIYSSKQGVELLVLKELQFFHFPMGVEFNIKEPIVYDDFLPNMFGGEPIKAKSKLYFKNVNSETNFCTLIQEMSLNTNDTKNIILQIIKKMKPNDVDMKKVLENSVFEINDKNTYEYYYNPGIPHKIETSRETIVDIDKEKGKRIDKTIIELIYKD